MISLTEAKSEPIATIAANDAKPSIGKTGVHLHYHKHHEYKKLTCEQCRELSEWRQSNPDAHKPSYIKKPCGTDKSMRSKKISTLVSNQVAAEIQKLNKLANVDTTLTAQKAASNDEQYHMSVVQSTVAKHFATPPITCNHPTGKPSSRRPVTTHLDGVQWFPPSIHLRGEQS